MLSKGLLLVTVFSLFLEDASAANPTCKAIPGQAGWPSATTWQNLNSTVGGRLLAVPPPGGACHAGEPNFNLAVCTQLQTEWYTYAYHAQNPISNGWQNWNNDTCLPNPATPCSGQGYPTYVINATSPQDVQAGVNFARENNVRLIVKASGHDFRGRSVAPNSLSIWTANMGKVQSTQLGSFTPQGCNYSLPFPSLTALAGSTSIDVDRAADAVNHTVIAGGATTVNLGGYVTGAGHGLLASQFGLAADNTFEIEMVTPEGNIVVANECQNTDLFWAMRGGGGSTFGVMTSITMKMQPQTPLMALDIGVGNYDVLTPDLYNVVAYIMSQMPNMSDLGLAGYSQSEFNFPSIIPGVTSNMSQWSGNFVLPNTSNPNDILALWQPVIQHIQATWPGWISYNQTTYFPTFLDWYAVNNDTSPTGFDMILGTRLLSKAAVTTNLSATAAAIQDMASTAGYVEIDLISGPGVHEAQPRGGGDSVNPGWRTSYIETIGPVPIVPLLEASRDAAVQTMRSVTAKITALSPDTGTYLNEASPYVLDWQQAFWGSNYPRLVSIKQKYDPNTVFWCEACVGSEGWEMVGAQLCKSGP